MTTKQELQEFLSWYIQILLDKKITHLTGNELIDIYLNNPKVK